MNLINKVLCAVVFALMTNPITAQCVPDPNDESTDGISPTSLKTAWLDSSYTMVITSVVPLDTTITVLGTPIVAMIDSIDVTGVKGLPSGYTYASNPLSGHFKGGTKGCTLISGTTSDAALVGVHPLVIYINIYGAVSGFPQPALADSIESYVLTIQAKGASGLNSYTSSKAGTLLVYPNPTVGKFNFSVALNETDAASIKVFSPLGQLVIAENAELTNASFNSEIDLSGFAPGIYFLEITSRAGTIIQKVMLTP